MDDQEIPAKYKDTFQLVFVTMFWNDTPDEIYAEVDRG